MKIGSEVHCRSQKFQNTDICQRPVGEESEVREKSSREVLDPKTCHNSTRKRFGNCSSCIQYSIIHIFLKVFHRLVVLIIIVRVILLLSAAADSSCVHVPTSEQVAVIFGELINRTLLLTRNMIPNNIIVALTTISSFIMAIYGAEFPINIANPCMWICAIIQAVLRSHVLGCGSPGWGMAGSGWGRRCWCGACNKTDRTIDSFHTFILTLISISTLPFSCSTGLTVKLVIALLIEDAVIIGLLKGEPQAVLHLIALRNAFLESGDGKWVNKVSFALECPMTFPGRTSEEKTFIWGH